MISIIVPIYNTEKYLRRCIDSILAQTYKDYELILVDDGSTDNCGEICDKYKKSDTRIKVIHKSNGGISDARNAGLDMASGEYIVFVDGDDYIAPTMVEKLYADIIANKADLAICGFEFVDENGKRIPKELCYELSDGQIDSIDALAQLGSNISFTPIWNKIYKHELFTNIRFPYGKLYEDAFVIHEILFQCPKISLISEKLYNYVIRSDSIMHSPVNIRTLDEAEAFYTRYIYYEKNNLKDLLPDTAKKCFDTFLRRRKGQRFRNLSDIKRYFQVKRMVRYCYRRNSEKIRKIEIFSFEMPLLFMIMRGIKRFFFNRSDKKEREQNG